MEKEFVPYELALRMKELGFDEPCLKFVWSKYESKAEWINCNGKYFHYQEMFKKKERIYGRVVDFYSISIPTISQAIKWFRKKYGLKGYIAPVEYLDDTADTYHWCIYNVCNSGNDQLTYEEAELACLEKLIEIAEEQEKK